MTKLYIIVFSTFFSFNLFSQNKIENDLKYLMVNNDSLNFFLKKIGNAKRKLNNLSFEKRTIGFYINGSSINCDSITSFLFTFHHFSEFIPPKEYDDVKLNSLCSLSKMKNDQNVSLFRSIDNERIYISIIFEENNNRFKAIFIFNNGKYLSKKLIKLI